MEDRCGLCGGKLRQPVKGEWSNQIVCTECQAQFRADGLRNGETIIFGPLSPAEKREELCKATRYYTDKEMPKTLLPGEVYAVGPAEFVGKFPPSEFRPCRPPEQDGVRRYIHLEDTVWPNPLNLSDVEWDLRYGEPSHARLVLAASIIHAYRNLLTRPAKDAERVMKKLRKEMRKHAAKRVPPNGD